MTSNCSAVIMSLLSIVLFWYFPSPFELGNLIVLLRDDPDSILAIHDTQTASTVPTYMYSSNVVYEFYSSEVAGFELAIRIIYRNQLNAGSLWKTLP